jgi:large subunit ribosomal protein L34e
MPLPKNRSNSVRKVHVKTPKGNTIHYSRKRTGHRHSCVLTGNPLQAVSSVRSNGTKPNRKFGGSLSSAAASRIIVIASRVKEGAMKLDEVDLTMLPYVKRLLASKK